MTRSDTGSAPCPGGFGLYVHWPFCQSKCPYCDFNSHVRATIDEGRWRAALLAELEHFANKTPGRRLDTLFFGGGTPSLMAPATVAAVIDAAARHWTMAGDVEITLEANPGSVDAGRFTGYRAAGINRLSLGVQSLDDAALRFLGRRHDAAEALGAIALTQATFPRLSFDLIYALPGQTCLDWRRELTQALKLAGEHLSLYQLTIESETAFGAAFRRGELVPMGEDAAAELFELTQELTETAGLPAYEISNHARPGAESRHNLIYWRYGDYAGIGPGAHGRLTLDGVKTAFRQHRAPEAWLDAVETAGHATRTQTPVPAEECFTEMLMMGLRLGEGVALARLTAETDRSFTEIIDDAKIGALVAGGFLLPAQDRLVATAAGRQRLNAVLATLLGSSRPGLL